MPIIKSPRHRSAVSRGATRRRGILSLSSLALPSRGSAAEALPSGWARGERNRPKSISRHEIRERAYFAAKRSVDIVVALAAIILLSPVLLVAAAVIKCTDRGPVFYAHKRVGKDLRTFCCWKFRTMSVDAKSRLRELAALNDHGDQRTFKMQQDPRVTLPGRWMRKFSIDELPQLWNVLNGDMTLVGPRPPIPAEVALYSASDLKRLSVTPGLTCTWQVSGRSNIAFPEQLKMDLEYIANRTLLMDLKLLAMTIPAVISGRGAY
jgi:lipopolysaccharide/colanic/teichoic acid biosynthesis glycosyltransferase